MSQLAYTLLTDGSSNQMLMAAIDWLLATHAEEPFQRQWADLRLLPKPPKLLGERIRLAVELYPCDLLFVHRDAERESHAVRADEIERALPAEIDGWVPVIPIRMQEAWFLFDEAAIREAAGNPSGDTELDLPALKRVEQIPDPKDRLDQALRSASGLHGRRLEKMKLGQAKHRLSSLISDFSPLRELAAFAALETALLSVLASKGLGR